MLIEGPADADPLLDWVLTEGMEPPLALLAYVPDQPKIAAFWPYAVFSPEWQAMTWALRRGIEVAFCDLPAAMTLAPRPRTLLDDPEEVDPEDEVPAESSELVQRAGHDPLGALAEAAGYDDPERWWDDVVESRLDGSSPFPALTEAMAELRLIMGGSNPAARPTASGGARRTCARPSVPRSSGAGAGWRWSAERGTRRP